MVDVSFEKIMSSSVIYQELIDYNLWVERIWSAISPAKLCTWQQFRI